MRDSDRHCAISGAAGLSVLAGVSMGTNMVRGSSPDLSKIQTEPASTPVSRYMDLSFIRSIESGRQLHATDLRSLVCKLTRCTNPARSAIRSRPSAVNAMAPGLEMASFDALTKGPA